MVEDSRAGSVRPGDERPGDDDGPSRLDPARHLLAEGWNRLPWYETQPPPAGADVPVVGLDRHVPEWRVAIREQTDREPSPDRVDAVVISQDRTRIIAELLRELSMRLRRGTTAGPIHSDGSISRLAADLAEDLQNRSWR